jgi:hypothetical protein
MEQEAQNFELRRASQQTAGGLSEDVAEDEEYNFDLSSGLISEFYNKKVSFRVIDLKYLHLNTSILVEYLANKLTSRVKVLRKYRLLLKKIKLPLYNKYTHSTVVDNSVFKALSLKNVDNITAKEIKTKLGASSHTK